MSVIYQVHGVYGVYAQALPLCMSLYRPAKSVLLTQQLILLTSNERMC
jgi:hypothetical protein